MHGYESGYFEGQEALKIARVPADSAQRCEETWQGLNDMAIRQGRGSFEDHESYTAGCEDAVAGRPDDVAGYLDHRLGSG
jgi:hypothetical protein